MLNLNQLPVYVPLDSRADFYSNVPFWLKFNIRVSGVNFIITAPDGVETTVARAAALTQVVNFFTLPTRVFLHAYCEKTAVAFVGVATLTNTIGITGTPTWISGGAPFDMKAAVSQTNFSAAAVGLGADTFDETFATVALTSTVQNLSALSIGSLDLWLQVSIMN